MNKGTLIIAIQSLFLVLSCTKIDFPHGNNPPVIESIVVYPDTVFHGDTVNLSFTATDADGDSLSAIWEARSGTLLSDPFRWVAPQNPGEYSISLKIFDQSKKGDTEIATIVVLDTFGVFIDARDGHSYKWVHIGKQTWMAENLAYLPAVSPSSIYSDYWKQFYVYGFEGTDLLAAKASDNYKTFGVLYNYPASKDACPAGWQMPDTVNWKTLTGFLGSDAAGDLKSIMGWKNDYWGVDGNGNNSAGFNAAPGGCYYYTYGHGGYGAFIEIGETSKFHSQNGRAFVLLRSNSYSRIEGTKGEDGYSVRCIKKTK